MNTEDDNEHTPLSPAPSEEQDDLFMSALDEALDGARLPTRGRPPRTDGLATNQLWEMSRVHEDIIEWLILNPGARQKDVAAHFGYSLTWISNITRSDIFKARLAERKAEVYSQVHQDVQEKMTTLADIGIEKIQEELETSQDKRFLLDVTRMALTGLGFGANKSAAPAGVQNQQNNFYVASQADLEAARGRIAGRAPVSGSLPGPAPVDATPLEAPVEEPIEVRALKTLHSDKE